MNQDKKINIDSALSLAIGQHTPVEGGDYADFLEKLAEHDKKHVLIDVALEEKLQSATIAPSGSWKKIVALIWYRRLRNAGVLILLLTAFGYAINGLIDRKDGEKNAGTPFNKPPTSTVMAPEKRTNESFNESLKQVTTSADELIIHNESNGSNVKIKTTEWLNQTSEEKDKDAEKKESPFTNSITSSDDNNIVRLNLAGLAKILPVIPAKWESMAYLPFPPTEKPKEKKRAIPDAMTGFVIGLNLMYSVQNYHSKMNAGEQENTNRNYDALANNGQMPGQVLNYGLSVEKSVYKGLGFSVGINKFTMKQTQKSDYTLTEAPVYDLDGHIAGYISIMPEKINTTIENKLQYIAVPVNLMYGLKLGNRNSIQFKIGSSMLGNVNKQTQKFDYSTLELKTYNNDGKKYSFNNLQYGISITRNLQNNLLLSAGYERQILYKVNQLSDNTEKINSTINNFTLSFKYQL